MRRVQEEPSVLGTVVAEREYRSARRKVIVQIGTPRRASWKTDFQCPIRIVIGGKSTLNAAYGIDSVQALMLAFDAVEAELTAISPPVRWIGGSRPGDTGIYRRITMSLGREFDEKLQRLVDGEVERQLRARRGRSGTR
jgi:hypothetical protein